MELSSRQVLDLVERSMRGARAQVRREMSRGLSVLATVAATAPMLGVFGTMVSIPPAFNMIGDSNVRRFIPISGGMAEALVTTAAAMAVAVPVYMVYRVFAAQVEQFDGEMESASMEVMNFVSRNLCATGTPRRRDMAT